MATSEYQKPPFAKFNLHLHIYSSNIFSYSNIEIVYPLPLWMLFPYENMNFMLIFKSVEKKRKPNQDMFCNSKNISFFSKALISGCSRVIPLRFHSRKFNNWEKHAICQCAVIDDSSKVLLLLWITYFLKRKPPWSFLI